MTKKEFMNHSEVPQFIKDLIADLPEGIGVGFANIEIDKKPVFKDCSCGDCEELYKDGVCIAPIFDNIASSMSDLLDLGDCQGNVKREDLERVKAIAYALQGSASALLIAASGGVLK